MLSISGYSGSPVFAYRAPFATRPDKSNIEPIERVFFLGVDTGHTKRPETVRLKATGEPHPEPLFVWANTAMATVVPAWKVSETLQLPDLIDNRRAERELLKKQMEQEALEIELDTQPPLNCDDDE
jgi:hypothetical protein